MAFDTGFEKKNHALVTLCHNVNKFSRSRSCKYFCTNENKIQWELSGNKCVSTDFEELKLCLTDGALQASICFSCTIKYHNAEGNERYKYFDQMNCNVKKGEALQLRTFCASVIPCFLTPAPETHFHLTVTNFTPLIPLPPGSSLTHALSTILNEETEGLNNIILYFGPEENPLGVNKFMLKTRSPVFRRMFDSNLREAKNNEVKISDISLSVGKEMIRFMYTDSPHVETMVDDDLKELWYVAEKYELSGLKVLCQRELMKRINTGNAVGILLFAAKFPDNEEFKDFILSFITKDKETCSAMIGCQEWEELMESFPEIANKYSDELSKPAAKKPRAV